MGYGFGCGFWGELGEGEVGGTPGLGECGVSDGVDARRGVRRVGSWF